MDFGSQTKSNSATPTAAFHPQFASPITFALPVPLCSTLIAAGTGVWAYTVCALTFPLSVPECYAESRAIEFGPWMPQGTV